MVVDIIWLILPLSLAVSKKYINSFIWHLWSPIDWIYILLLKTKVDLSNINVEMFYTDRTVKHFLATCSCFIISQLIRIVKLFSFFFQIFQPFRQCCEISLSMETFGAVTNIFFTNIIFYDHCFAVLFHMIIWCIWYVYSKKNGWLWWQNGMELLPVLLALN